MSERMICNLRHSIWQIKLMVDKHDEQIAAGHGHIGNVANWINSPFMLLYIRAACRTVNGRMQNVIDLASIEVPPHYRRRGNCAALLTELEKLALTTQRCLSVENVIGSELHAYLLRRDGYVKEMTYPASPNFYYAPSTTAVTP
jgi:hypothetical protein